MDSNTENIEKAKAGDAESFVTLMEEHKYHFYKTAKAILKNDEDAADAVSETILICWKELHKLRNNNFFRTWATRICINSCKKIIRDNKGIVYVESYNGIEPSTEENLNEKINYGNINPKYTIILDLYYNAGYSVKEIAQIMKLNENTVKTRLSRGRNEYKKFFLLERKRGLCEN